MTRSRADASRITNDSLVFPRYSLEARPAREGLRVMISSLKILNYRAFADFEMTNLGRVNLLVGKNNTGKTSILEGLFILASGSNPTALWQIINRRGEQVMPEPTPNRGVQAEVDICHLFHGHEIKDGTELTISTVNGTPDRSVTYKIDVAKPEENPQLFAQLSDEGVVGPRLAFRISGTDYTMPPLPISKMGSLRADVMQQYAVMRPAREGGTAQFVTSEWLSIGQIIQHWNAIVLTQDEERVTRALQILEPTLNELRRLKSLPCRTWIALCFPQQGRIICST